jgi:hypothetical protein
MRNQTDRKNKMSSFPVWEIPPVDARLTVVREVAPRMPARSQEILWVKLLATMPIFGVRAATAEIRDSKQIKIFRF